MPSRLLASTPFRLVLLLGSAFLVALGIAAAVAFTLIRDDIHARTERDIADTYGVIERSFAENDVSDLEELVRSHVAATLEHNEVFRLEGPDGATIAGNIAAMPEQDGWATRPAAALGLPEAVADYRILSGHVGPYRLAVGVSLAETEAIGWTVLVVVGWTVGGLALAILLLGGLAAIRGQRRLDAIAGTMERIAHGQMQARIPRSGRGDDIDVLVGNVNAALDRLAALVEGMRQVSVDIAHELKTPLNRLSIAVGSAIEAADEESEIRPLLEEARQEAGQVTAIFDAMLRIAQIESGARRARFAPVPLAPILETVADAYGPVAADRDQALSLAVAPDIGGMQGDKDLLMQAFANIVENAIRHCPEGTSIRIAGRVDEGCVRVTISDDGPGIPDAEKPKVFDRLYRLEKSRSTPGNGLGLSLVKAIVELHGGSVGLADNGPGLKVSIALPATGLSSLRPDHAIFPG